MDIITLNHDAETATEMLNLKKEDGQRIRNLITFETIKGHLLADELYSDDSVAPRTLTTKSGCIERCLDRLYNESEKALFFMLFINAHEGVGKAYMLYKHLDMHMQRFISNSDVDISDNSIDGRLKKLVLEKIKQDIKDRFSIIDDVISHMKTSNYNYELFMDSFTEEHGDLTYAISDALSVAKNSLSHNDED